MEIKYETQNKINKLYPVIVILLIIGWGYRELGNRADRTELESAAVRLQSNLDGAIAKLHESEVNISKLEQRLKDAQVSITNSISTVDGITGRLTEGERIESRNIELIKKLQDGLPSLQNWCRVEDIKP